MSEQQTSNPGRNRRLDRRRPPRGRIRVICQRGSMELGRNLGLSVLDLSETGARLLLSESCPAGQEVSITLESMACVRPVKRVGKVAWCLATQDGTFAAGVQFEKRLEYRQYLELT